MANSPQLNPFSRFPLHRQTAGKYTAKNN